MKKILELFRLYWNQFLQAGKTRIIGVDHSHGFIQALEFHPLSQSFSKISPLDPILKNRDTLLITALDSSLLFHGKIEGLPASFEQQVFQRKEKIEGQIAQKVLWDLKPYSYLYEFRKIDAKKTDLFFTLTSKEHLKECKNRWQEQGIFPSTLITPLSVLAHYLQFQKVSFPCVVLLKRNDLIEKFEFENAQDVAYSTMEEMDLFSFASCLDNDLQRKKFVVSNFESPTFESDLFDRDLFLKGLCLQSLTPLKKWSSDPWNKQLNALLPLTLPSGKSFKKATYAFLGLAVLFSSFRFFSFYHELRVVDDDLPFWKVAGEKKLLEEDFLTLQYVAAKNRALQKALHQKSLEKINSLARDLYPLSIQIDHQQMEIVFATPDDEASDELLNNHKKELLKKVDHLHGTVVRDDQKILVISFPLGSL